MQGSYHFDLLLRNTKSELQAIKGVLHAVQKCSIADVSELNQPHLTVWILILRLNPITVDE